MLRRPLPVSASPEGDAPDEGAPAPLMLWAWVALTLSPIAGLGLLARPDLRAGLWWLPWALLAVALLAGGPRRLVGRLLARWWALPWTWRPAGVLTPAAAGLWVSGRTLASAVLCTGAALGPVITALRWRTPSVAPERTHLVKSSADEEWRARVVEEWVPTAVRAGLHHPDDPAETVALTGAVLLRGGGALRLDLDLRPARLAPEDVSRAIPGLVRGCRAPHVVVHPVDPHDIDEVRVWLWKGRHPLDYLVTWRDLTPLPDTSGEWVPVGKSAVGGPVALRWRISTLHTGEPESGKTGAQRAFMFGCRVQGVPAEWWVVDTKGDYRVFAPALGDRYAGSARDAVGLLARFRAAVEERYADNPAMRWGDPLVPSARTPALLLIVGELLHLVDSPRGLGADDARTLYADLKWCAASGRAAGAAVHASSQLPQKDELGGFRDLLGQRSCGRVPNAPMVDPALGEGAWDRGARATEIPASLRGAAYVMDADTRWPVPWRAAWIEPAEVPDLFGLREAA